MSLKELQKHYPQFYRGYVYGVGGLASRLPAKRAARKSFPKAMLKTSSPDDFTCTESCRYSFPFCFDASDAEDLYA